MGNREGDVHALDIGGGLQVSTKFFSCVVRLLHYVYVYGSGAYHFSIYQVKGVRYEQLQQTLYQTPYPKFEG